MIYELDNTSQCNDACSNEISMSLGDMIMPNKIIINNIKHIRNLVFEIPTSSGAYVLTGSNGSGKTTLMTTLLRIGWYRAFQDHFKTGSERIDAYEGEVIYQTDRNSISYHHAGSRWTPRPRSISQGFFQQFGYPEVRFLPATGNRLYIQDDVINPTDFRAVEEDLKQDLNYLLETSKFSNLRYVQTGSSRGPGGGSQRWKRAYVIRSGRRKYYSEKNFSLGEILVLNTLALIRDVPAGSMLLIDELEMALHPRVQIRLLNYLKNKAIENNLTVIISTHSSSLIKSADKLIYLENQGDGNILVRNNCYPALVLREVAIEEDIQPDYVFMVEDDMAEMLTKEMVKYYYQLEPTRQIPLYKVLPIGGYPQVLGFASLASEYLFNSKIGQYILLDADVEQTKTELTRKGNNRTVDEQQLFELFQSLEIKVKYLPITPELGIWQWLTTQTASIQQDINSHYPDTVINLQDLIEQTDRNYATDTDSERKKAKRRLKFIVKLLEGRVNEDSRRINQFLFGVFVKYLHLNNNAIIRCIFAPIFNTRGNRIR